MVANDEGDALKIKGESVELLVVVDAPQKPLSPHCRNVGMVGTDMEGAGGRQHQMYLPSPFAYLCSNWKTQDKIGTCTVLHRGGYCTWKTPELA